MAVLPVGSTEPHGQHLPYGCDALHAEMVAEEACGRAAERGAAVALLPTIPYGVNANTLGFPMTMSVRQRTLDAIVEDLVASLLHHGVANLVIMNGHGGNDFKPLLREASGRTDMFVSLVEWWTVGADVADEIFETVGDHADEMETSVALALFGHLVEQADAGSGRTNPARIEAIERGWAQISRPWHLLAPDAGVGDPTGATAEKGRQYLDLVVERIAGYLVDLSGEERDATFPY